MIKVCDVYESYGFVHNQVFTIFYEVAGKNTPCYLCAVY